VQSDNYARGPGAPQIEGAGQRNNATAFVPPGLVHPSEPGDLIGSSLLASAAAEMGGLRTALFLPSAQRLSDRHDEKHICPQRIIGVADRRCPVRALPAAHTIQGVHIEFSPVPTRHFGWTKLHFRGLFSQSDSLGG
jgi:hypothetical protein